MKATEREYEKEYADGEEKRTQREKKMEKKWEDDYSRPENSVRDQKFPGGQIPYQRVYQLIREFVDSITPHLDDSDTTSMAVATYLANFCFEMCMMLQSFGTFGKTYFPENR